MSWVWVATVFGLLGTPTATAVTGRFSFLAPLSLFALFCGNVPVLRDRREAADHDGRRFWPRVKLAAFIAVCFGYYRVCGRVFLVSGWGFLTGFPVVVALAWWWQRWDSAHWRGRPGVWALRNVTAFSAYYWTSALAILWNAK